MTTFQPPTPSNSNGDVELRNKVSDIVRWNSWTLSNEEATKALMELIQTERTQAATEALNKVCPEITKILLEEYPDKLNTDLTGHGALDIAGFAINNLKRLSNPEQPKEDSQNE